MIVLGYILAAIGFLAPLMAAMLGGANYESAGYTAGPGYLFSIAVLIYTVFAVRKATPEKRGGTILIAGIVVLAINLWFCVRIVEDAGVHREVLASKAEIDRITQAALEEIAAISSGQPDGQVSTEWQRYATPAATIDLANDAIPLRERLIEMTRRGRAREVEFARTMNREVEESGLAYALDPESLLDSQHRADSLRRLERYRQFINSLGDCARKLMEMADTDFKSLKLPTASEQEMLVGRKRRERDDTQQLEAMIASERAVIDQVEALVRFVEAHKSSAQVSNDALEFRDAANQAEFDGMLAQLEAAAPTR